MGYAFDDIYPLLQQNFGKRYCRKRVGYYNSLSVDFGDKTYHNRIKTTDNEIIEFRLPDHKTLVLCAEQGWQLGQSDKPWPNHIEI